MRDIIELGAEAMRAKRRELINQPLDRIWPDLMKAALAAISEPMPPIGDSKWFANEDAYKASYSFPDNEK